MVDLAWLADDVTRNEYNRQISVLDAMAESDPETALLVLRLPWVADDVTDSELRMLSSVGKFAEQDPRLGRLVADLPWFAKGLDDHDSRHLLESIAERNPELAVLVAGYGWFVDGVGDYGEADSAEIFALEALSDIAARGPELARAVSELAWIADGIIYFEESALRYLGSMAEKDLELAVEAAGAPWVKDGIVRHEVFALDGLVEMVDRNPEFARQVLDFSVEAPVSDRDVYLILSLHSLQTEQLDRLIGQPWFTDGLDPEERAFITALSTPNTAVFDGLLESHFTQSATITLPLAGEVNLWAFQRVPFPPGEDLMAMIREGVRGAERFMGTPFPTTDVIVLLVEDSKYLGGFGGTHNGSKVRFARSGNSPVSRPLVYHELAHYYLDDSIGPRWLTEGGADFIWAYTNGWLGLESMKDQLRKSARYAQERCVRHGIENVHQLGAPDPPEPRRVSGCVYGLGRHFLISLFETVGEAAVSSALRELYLRLLTAPDSRPTEKDVYRTFLKYVTSGLEEEFRDLYRRLHGGPFVDAKD